MGVAGKVPYTVPEFNNNTNINCDSTLYIHNHIVKSGDNELLCMNLL